eukprot:131728-Chlamydomonas_euryale.AAC.1
MVWPAAWDALDNFPYCMDHTAWSGPLHGTHWITSLTAWATLHGLAAAWDALDKFPHCMDHTA